MSTVKPDDKFERLLEPVNAFLYCETPQRWLDQALEQQDILLIDHANCEKKAASTALNLIYRYIDYPDLLYRLSRLAREELRHFEQVLAIMQQRNVEYVHVSASRYASGLREKVSKRDPEMLVDTLICGAIIEARSCERFAALAPLLDEELRDFYLSLLKSEARHFKDYLALAKNYVVTRGDLDESYITIKTGELLQLDAELVTAVDSEFRFHSGPMLL